MTATAFHEALVDYSGFDFPRLWEGREIVSTVERTVVGQALSGGDRRRILEVGTGFGRLLGTLVELGQEVVATDFDAAALERVPGRAIAHGVTRVAANLYHLPFVERAFTAATLVRVHHHLLDPTAALTEIGRVLQGSSRLVVSYQPRPSVGTLVGDVQRALRPPAEGRLPSVSFTRGPIVLASRPFPIRSAGRRQFEEESRAAGFEVRSVVGTGFEEYAPLRRFGPDRFVRIGAALGRAPAFPTRFTILEKTGAPSEDLPARTEMFACPRCRDPRPDWSRGTTLRCDRCGYEGARRGAVLDFRYVPPDVRRWQVDP